MQMVAPDANLFWCPRCGTLLELRGPVGKERPNAEAPKLVQHCRGFERTLTDPSLLSAFRALGISESINTPANRRKA